MYNKLFKKLLDSSVWLTQSPETVKVWVCFLAAMDEDGHVEINGVASLAHRAVVPVEATEAAVKYLESPDPASAHEEDDGTRIERVPGGWQVLNATKYRDFVTRNEIREATRRRVQKHRDLKKAGMLGNVTSVTRNASVTQSDQIRSDQKNKTKDAPRPRADQWTPIERIKNAYPKRNGNQPWKRAEKALNARIREGHSIEQILEGVGRYRAWCEGTGKIGTETVQQAATFLGPELSFLLEWNIPVKKNGAAAVDAAWERVMQHCKSSAYRKSLLGDEAIDAAVKSVGGYSAIAMIATGQLPFLKRQFAAALKAGA